MHHERHLDDLTQFVAMKLFERGDEPSNWQYFYLNYCQENGLSQKYGKMGAQTLERSVFVGIDDDSDENNNRSFLLDLGEVERAKEQVADSFSEILQEALGLKNEVIQWVMEHCQFKVRTK